MRKPVIVLLALTFVCFFNSSAAAIILGPNSESMCNGQDPNRAGSLYIYFSAADIIVLKNWFTAGNEWALLRFTLSGVDIKPGSPPKLAVGIIGDPANDLNFATPAGAYQDVVDLEEVGVEVSDYEGGMDADLTAYVTGTLGNQYFEVIITAVDGNLPTAGYPVDHTQWPYLRVGLDPSDAGVVITDNESHAIWADLTSFIVISKLEVALDTNPLTLTYTPGDDEIGHFGTSKVTVSVTGTGGGTVTSNPAGINCTGDCEECLAIIAEYTLTANQQANSYFIGWSGDCSGADPCTITTFEPKNISARFVSASGGSGGGGCFLSLLPAEQEGPSKRTNSLK